MNTTVKLMGRLLIYFLLLPLGILAAKEKKEVVNATIDRTLQLRTHSIYAPYIDQDLQNRWWDFGADAYVNTNKHIRLTRSRPSEMGWLWSRLPITSTNYVIEVEFKITGDSSHLFGDGLALWITKSRAQPGPVFGSIDKFEGLGVFLDTYANARHPYSFPRVTAMLGDGTKSYDQGNDGEAHSIGACSANYRRTNVATKMRVTYIKDTSVDVRLQYKAWDEWTECFKIEGISLPSNPFLGFSAMTGDVFDAHDIISVTTSSAVLADASRPRDKLRGVPTAGEGSGSWFTFTLKLFLFVGVCLGALYGYQTYSKRNGAGTGFGRRRGGYGGDMFGNSRRF